MSTANTSTTLSEVNLDFQGVENGINIYNQVITPQLALRLIESNHDNNRKINKKVVDSYARQMLNGQWKVTGEALKIDINNKFCDGQHRINGVIVAGEMAKAANRPFHGIEFMVISGIPLDAMTAMDDGYKRNLNHALDMVGKKRNHQTAINQCIQVLMNLHGCALTGKHFDAIRAGRRNSTVEIISFYDNLPNFKQSCTSFFEKFVVKDVKRIMPIGSALAMYYLFREENQELIYGIFESYESGLPFDGKGKTSPIYKVIRKIQHAKEMKISMRPWEHVQTFLWGFTKSLENSTDPIPRLMPWKWDTSNPIISIADKKLRSL